MPIPPEQLDKMTIEQYTQRCKVDEAGGRFAEAARVTRELRIVNPETVHEESKAYKAYVRAKSGLE